MIFDAIEREHLHFPTTKFISDVPYSANSKDDIIVWGRTLAEHNERLNNVFLKTGKIGLKLNKNKCQTGVMSTVFPVHIISSEGVNVDPAKVEVITKIPLPNFVNELQRVLGMVTCLGKLKLLFTTGTWK